MKTSGHKDPESRSYHLKAYFDNNATSMVAPEVVAKMMPLWSEHFGNPSSVHRMGQRAAEEVADARSKVAALLGAKAASEIVFTGSGTEADNLAILGTLRGHPTKKHLITTEVEHPAVLRLCERLVADEGYEVSYLAVNGAGEIDLDELRNALRPDTVLVSIMLANNETGVVFDVEQAGRIVQQHGAVFHVDGVQAAGRVPLQLADWPVDLFTLSGHKLHGGKGVGALYVRRGVPLQPVALGGKQERGRRAGTENVAAIAGFGVACELANEFLKSEDAIVGDLRDRLEKGILSDVPDATVNGGSANRVPNTTNISFTGVEGEGVLLSLDRQGIAVSSGAACSSGSMSPSHVLLAMGLPEEQASAAVRFSLSRYTTEVEVDLVTEVLPEIIAQLRRGELRRGEVRPT